MHKLNNGDYGIPCEFKDGGYKCKLLAYQLSLTDTPIGNSLTLKQQYQRVVRYKCGNGHLFTKTSKIKIDLLQAKAH